MKNFNKYMATQAILLNEAAQGKEASFAAIGRNSTVALIQKIRVVEDNEIIVSTCDMSLESDPIRLFTHAISHSSLEEYKQSGNSIFLLNSAVTSLEWGLPLCDEVSVWLKNGLTLWFKKETKWHEEKNAEELHINKKGEKVKKKKKGKNLSDRLDSILELSVQGKHPKIIQAERQYLRLLILIKTKIMIGSSKLKGNILTPEEAMLKILDTGAFEGEDLKGLLDDYEKSTIKDKVYSSDNEGRMYEDFISEMVNKIVHDRKGQMHPSLESLIELVRKLKSIEI